MLGFYNPSVILTYISLVSAAVGFSFVLGSADGAVFSSLICMMVSGVCDMFDGAVAALCQRTEEEKVFGIQIDALCDLVAFGALPALIGMRLGENSLFSVIGAAALLLSSVIRLGYFNVQETMRDRSEKRTGYLGLPVTAVAAVFPLLLVLGSLLNVSFGIWVPLCLLILAALEITPFTLKKPYGKGKLLVFLFGAVVFALLLILGRSLKG